MMAEAAAVVGLVESIASLIDLGTKVTFRLREFAAKAADLVTRQAQAGHLSDDVVNALHALITSTSTQVSILQKCLSQISPPNDVSRVQGAAKALKSLAKENDIRAAVEKVHQDIDFLVLHQTTQYIDNSARILEELTKLDMVNDQSLLAQRGHYIASVSAYDRSSLVVGDVYNYGVLFSQQQEPDKIEVFGLCLGSAPLIDADNFFGRAAELDQMKQILHLDESTTEQQRLVLGGMGGIGKTQLAIAYARLYQARYTSVFWLDATTELTLKQSFRSVGRRLLKAPELERLDDEQIIFRAHDWLSDRRNTDWLLIFDNYDNPDQFAINDYVPNTAHGSVVITTRLPELVSGQQVRLQPIRSLEESLEILQTRSQRDDAKNDLEARYLAQRLAGLPLALVTAGAYLRKTALTFCQYLEAYNQRFNINPRRPIQLQEYQDRTLYTTWYLSYSRLESDDPLAAKALKLFAYFDNQEIWYELLHTGLTDDLPLWLQDFAAEKVDFESTMGTLVDYCLLEVHPTTQSYSIHNCVHDWTLAELNKAINPQLYWYVQACVIANIGQCDLQSLGKLHYARLARHALRCAHPRFTQSLLGAVSWNRLNTVF